MTEETKKLFDAPWQICGDGCQVCDTRGTERVHCDDIKDSARYAHLPELYDKLMWSVVQKCPDAFLALDECRLCADKKCEYREIVELLRKVKDGK